MKHTALLLGLLLLSGFLIGQEDIKTKNTLRFGVNRAFFGSGDILGPAIYGEYAYALNDYFSVTPRIMSGYGHEKGDWYYNHASSFGASLSIRVTPLPNAFRRLKVDMGGLYHKFINSDGNLEESSSSSSSYSKEELLGLFGSLNVNIIDTKRMESGVRFDVLTNYSEGYLECDSYQTGIYLGVKF